MTSPLDPQEAGPPIVWSIAGSDSGAGAGLQADLKAFEAFGVHGCTAVAALTAQNSRAVTDIFPVSAATLDAQLAALAEDMPPAAIKTGLLGSVENVGVVCRWVDRLREGGSPVALVVDPVFKASSGASFSNAALAAAYREQLLPRASLITPNRAEAAQLAGLPDDGSDNAVETIAAALLALGTQSLAVTGGDHGAGMARDYMHTAQARGWLRAPRVATPHNHGTGCVFAASAAAALALGHVCADALVLAKMATSAALRNAYPAGRGAGPVRPRADFAQQAVNLPALEVPGAPTGPFAPLSDPDLGVYAVVDSPAWVERVLHAGIRCVQLRIKNPQEPTLSAQIGHAVALARAVPGAQLFINDHWELALAHGAYGVHLGQEDLVSAELPRIAQAGVRLGISTHSYWEVARAHGIAPSYIACGPIFPTQAKQMPWIPQGLSNLRYWAGLLSRPVVGIAGIGLANMQEAAAQGVAGAAVISAITAAAEPEAACHQLMALFARGSGQSRPPMPPHAVPTLPRDAPRH